MAAKQKKELKINFARHALSVLKIALLDNTLKINVLMFG